MDKKIFWSYNFLSSRQDFPMTPSSFPHKHFTRIDLSRGRKDWVSFHIKMSCQSSRTTFLGEGQDVRAVRHWGPLSFFLSPPNGLKISGHKIKLSQKPTSSCTGRQKALTVGTLLRLLPQSYMVPTKANRIFF